MLTIFSIPKPFCGQNALAQHNAIQSWLKLEGDNEIILFGDDEGVAAAARKYQLEHCPEIQKNEFGTPLVSSAFELARQKAKNDILLFLNADIILVSDFMAAIKSISQQSYLLIGRRWDLEWQNKIDYQGHNWEEELKREVELKGKLHGYSGIDYMVFPKKIDFNMPSFAIGRQGWDNWLIWKVKKLGMLVIDATEVVTAIHQNHNYAHSRYGNKDRVGGPETIKNYALAGGFTNMLSIREADLVLTKNGLKKPVILRRMTTLMNKFYLWRLFLSIKRKIQSL